MAIDLDEAKINRNEGGLWLGWTLATTAGMLLGFLPLLLIVNALDLGIERVIVPLWAGLLVGLFQWLVLRGYVTRSADWIWTGGAAWSAGFAIGLLVIQNFTGNTLTTLLGYILFGIIVALLQWPVLRREVPHLLTWILANVVGWTLAFYLSQVFFLTLFGGRPASQVVNTAVIAVLSGLIAGGVTGAALVWIVQKPEREDFVERGA